MGPDPAGGAAGSAVACSDVLCVLEGGTAVPFFPSCSSGCNADLFSVPGAIANDAEGAADGAADTEGSAAVNAGEDCVNEALGFEPDVALLMLVGVGAFADATGVGATAWDFEGAVLGGIEAGAAAVSTCGREGVASLED